MDVELDQRSPLHGFLMTGTHRAIYMIVDGVVVLSNANWGRLTPNEMAAISRFAVEHLGSKIRWE